MITLQTPSFLLLDSETQTAKKIDRLIIKFQTPVKGKVFAWAVCEKNEGTEEKPNYVEVCNALHKEYEHTSFNGLDPLGPIHEDMKADLETLNPGVTFTTQI